MNAKLIVLLCFCLSLLLGAKKEVILWTYYNFPPFILDQQTHSGLSYDFIRLLNQKKEHNFNFKLVYLPRKRIDFLLAKNIPAAVLWVNPRFFQDEKQQTYAWSKALLYDQHDFISRKSMPIEYTGKASSLHPYRLGGVSGHKYIGLEEAFSNNLIYREDALTEQQNLQKLLFKRIDVTLMPQTTFRYFAKELGLDNVTHVSKTPLNTYSRHVLLQHNLNEAKIFLLDFLENLEENKAWQTLLYKYGLTPQMQLKPDF